MSLQRIAALIAILIITGCNSSGNPRQSDIAMRIVQQTDQSKIIRIDIPSLHDSFLQKNASSTYSGKVLEVSGKVVSFSMTDNMYKVTIRSDESDAVCFFNDSISGQLGDGRTVQFGAQLSIQGQCTASGIFSSTPFTLNGCIIVSN